MTSRFAGKGVRGEIVVPCQINLRQQFFSSQYISAVNILNKENNVGRIILRAVKGGGGGSSPLSGDNQRRPRKRWRQGFGERT